jgi:CDP-glucose 4,6-dehydratase
MEGLGLTPGFWSGRRVCVTGHTGFKGSWLCLWLVQLGAQVFGYGLEPDEPSLFRVARLYDDLVDVRADVTDANRLAAELRAWAPEVVMHLAAQSLVRRSYETPLRTYHTNVYGTAALLEAVRQTPSVRAVVVVTSDKCYDLHKGKNRFCEEDALGGDDPYSASKAATEHVVAAHRSSYWKEPTTLPRVATARSGNVLGGGDWSKDRLLPDLIAAFSAQRVALVRNPDAVRPWQHVLDPLRGYLMLAEQLCGDNSAAFARAWNFGPQPANEWQVRAIADRAAACFGTGAAWDIDARPHPHEAVALRLDSSLAAARLGWRASIPLSLGIERTIQWHKALAAGSSARDLVHADIEELSMARIGA